MTTYITPTIPFTREYKEILEIQQNVSNLEGNAELSKRMGYATTIAAAVAGTYTAIHAPTAFSNEHNHSVGDARLGVAGGISVTLTLAVLATWFFNQARNERSLAAKEQEKLTNGKL